MKTNSISKMWEENNFFIKKNNNMNRINSIVAEGFNEVCRCREAYDGKFVHKVVCIFFHLYG